MNASFTSHKSASLALLTCGADLRPKEGQFLGGIAFSDMLSDKQRNWLHILLDRHKLPPLADGGGQ